MPLPGDNNPTNVVSIPIRPYRPDDLSDGKALALEHGEKVDAPELLSSCLSLYFQWEEHRSCHLTLPHQFEEDGASTTARVVMSYDSDEASPSELQILISDASLLRFFREEGRAEIQFEVFNVSYRFAAPVLARDPTADAGWHLVIGMPEFLVVQKRRAIPRSKYIPNDLEKLSPPVLAAGERTSEISILEVGVNSIIISAPPILAKIPNLLSNPTNLKIHLRDSTHAAQIARATKERIYLHLQFSSDSTFKAYFDFYRESALPTLASRREVSGTSAFDLYEKTGYFGKFSPNPLENKEKIVRDWATVDELASADSVDLISVDPSGQPRAGTSLVNAFGSEGSELWAFHQACAMTDARSYQNTLEAYLWRPIYLYGLHCISPRSACVWFDGNSRWIERMWNLFFLQKMSEGHIAAVRVFRFLRNPEIQVQGPPTSHKHRSVLAGRRLAGGGRFKEWGLGPDLLNATQLLNGVLRDTGSISLSQLDEDFANIATQAEAYTEISLTVPANETGQFQNDSFIFNGEHKSNRFCRFVSADSAALYSTTIHAVTIMKKKLDESGTR